MGLKSGGDGGGDGRGVLLGRVILILDMRANVRFHVFNVFSILGPLFRFQTAPMGSTVSVLEKKYILHLQTRLSSSSSSKTCLRLSLRPVHRKWV